MVKVDLSRDYYGDLGLSSTSDLMEIKKQYKKLALIYHPDRNIGNSNLDATKFQKIQSAYEVLIDSTERAKYDANRRSAYFRTGSSNKGNPWSNVGRDYPAPPKPPTARNRPAPPPSRSAHRYDNFATPHQSAYQASYDSPQARKATYDAWESMKGHQTRDKTQPNPGTASGVPRPPPRAPPPSRRGETDPLQRNSHKNPRETYSTPRSQDNFTSRKNGFMPSTPGGDEQPAPRTAYYTQRDKQDAPPIPPRNSEFTQNIPESTSKQQTHIETDQILEPRISTPYASHGGERLNPFEAPAFPTRSKSCRESNYNEEILNATETCSANKSKTTHRTRSFGERLASMSVPSQQPMQDSSDSEGSAGLQKPLKERPSNLPKKAAFSAEEKTSKFTSRTPETSQTADEVLGSYPPPPPPPMFSHPNHPPDSGPRQPDSTSNESTQAKTSASTKPSLFSFKVEDDMFVNTESSHNEQISPKSGDTIGSKFTAKDWDGTFAAGSDSNIFEPIPTPSHTSPRRTQSNGQSRTKSPIKSRNPSTTATSIKATRTEPKGDAVFSAAEWAETFKPQTFMPPQIPVPSPAIPANRKISIPTPRLTTENGNATVVDPSHDTDKKSPFVTHEANMSNPPPVNIATPEPMDIDTPQTYTSEDTIPKFSLDPQKRRVSQPTPPNESDVQESTLKVHFSDLKIKDLILELPLSPNPPMLPQEKKPSAESYLDYELRFERYMAEWDQFDKKFLLHFVARKNSHEQLGQRRWKCDEVGTYRTTVIEDHTVLKTWAKAKESHEKAIKDWIILRDLRGQFDENQRPQKKKV